MIELQESRFSNWHEGTLLECSEAFVVSEQDRGYLVRFGDVGWWMEGGTTHTTMVLTEEEILREFPLTEPPEPPSLEELNALISKSLGLGVTKPPVPAQPRGDTMSALTEIDAVDDAALVAEMTGYLKGRARQDWRWVHYGDQTLRDVAFHADGSVKGDYDRLSILRGMVIANRRKAKRRSAAAKKASVTRKLRQDKKLQSLARAIVEQSFGGGFGYAHKCTVCGKAMSDDTSWHRGVGPDCWASAQSLAQQMISNREATP